MDYRVEPGRAADFGNAIKDYWPQLDAARLKPAYAGNDAFPSFPVPVRARGIFTFQALRSTASPVS